MTTPLMSVVVPFKDWGLERLSLCIQSILLADIAPDIEVIVSDYGSADARAVRDAATGHGVRHIRTETDGRWSRSRALNAGFAGARGEYFVATDADMIFLPGTFSAVAERLAQWEEETVILQCRDLPSGYSHSRINLAEVDWTELARVSQVRPRWGMGGFVAQHRRTFGLVRGYDERMHTYGGEDIDYGLRVRRAGSRINWFDHPRAGMYHVWHESFANRVESDPNIRKAVDFNRNIHRTDRTYVRNTENAQGKGSAFAPACTFLVDGGAATSPLHFRNEIESILLQEVGALEVLIYGVPDGLVDELEGGLQDERVRWMERASLASDALEAARSMFAVQHVPGTLHMPGRLGRLLEAATEGISLVSDRTMGIEDDGHLVECVATESATPGATLIRTDVARAIHRCTGTGPLAEAAFLATLDNSGLRRIDLDEVGRLIPLGRRRDAESIVEASIGRRAAPRAAEPRKAVVSQPWEVEQVFGLERGLLGPVFVEMSGSRSGTDPLSEALGSHATPSDSAAGASRLILETLEGDVLRGSAVLHHLSPREFRTLKRRGRALGLSSRVASKDELERHALPETGLASIVQSLLLNGDTSRPFLLLAAESSEAIRGAAELYTAALPGSTSAVGTIVHGENTRVRVGVITHDSTGGLLALLAKDDAPTVQLTLVLAPGSEWLPTVEALMEAEANLAH